jgi:hypothetical protein
MLLKAWCAGVLLCCQVLTGKRAEIIAAIREVQGAVAEDAWLEDYENDEGRYKVRWGGGGGAAAHMQRIILAANLCSKACLLPGHDRECNAHSCLLVFCTPCLLLEATFVDHACVVLMTRQALLLGTA